MSADSRPVSFGISATPFADAYPEIVRQVVAAERGGLDRIDEAAMAAGRDPAAIRRIYNIGGTITDGTRGDGPLVGPPEQWVETLTGWARAQRANAFVFWPADMETDQIERFATEVVPSVRKAFA